MHDLLPLLLATLAGVLLTLAGLGHLYRVLYLRPKLQAAREQEQRGLEEIHAKLKTVGDLSAQIQALVDSNNHALRRLAKFNKAHDEIWASLRAALDTGDPAVLSAALDAAEAKQRQAIADATKEPTP